MRHIILHVKCDECGTDIINMDSAMVEWIDEDGTISDVRVVHNPVASPHNNCYKHTNHFHRCDHHLEDVLANTNVKKTLGIA